MRRLKLSLLGGAIVAALVSPVAALPKNASSHHRWAQSSNRNRWSPSHPRKPQGNSPAGEPAGGGYAAHHPQYGRLFYSSAHRSPASSIAARSAVKHDYMKRSGYASGRPGYVVAHVVPLTHGGSDTPSNMEWVRASDLDTYLRDRTSRLYPSYRERTAFPH
jgi:hypothetical protein